jgi:hypothetical protein
MLAKTHLLQTTLTGVNTVLFLVLKTKDHAAHAGLSQQPVPLNPQELSLDMDLAPSQNSNLLTVHGLRATTDVVVVGTTGLGLIYNPTLLKLNKTIPTELLTATATGILLSVLQLPEVKLPLLETQIQLRML